MATTVTKIEPAKEAKTVAEAHEVDQETEIVEIEETAGIVETVAGQATAEIAIRGITTNEAEKIVE